MRIDFLYFLAGKDDIPDVGTSELSFVSGQFTHASVGGSFYYEFESVSVL